MPLGNPIQLGKRHQQVEDIRFSGAGADAGKEKVLDALVVQEMDTLWTAESGGVVRGTNLKVRWINAVTDSRDEGLLILPPSHRMACRRAEPPISC